METCQSCGYQFNVLDAYEFTPCPRCQAMWQRPGKNSFYGPDTVYVGFNPHVHTIPPAPRCGTCPLRRGLGCMLSKTRELSDGLYQRHPHVGADEFCELHPHYLAWALGEADRRLKALDGDGHV